MEFVYYGNMLLPIEGSCAMRIGILEDDDDQRQLLSLWLEAAGNSVMSAGTAAEFQRLVQKTPPELVILDWNLPESSGTEMLAWIRSLHGFRIPIMFCTARDSKEDLVLALEAGADDYLVKPLSQEETLARLNALARRSLHSEQKTENNFGPYRLDLQRKKLFLEGDQLLPLTTLEFDLANYLFQNCNALVRRDEALRAVWGRTADITTRTVDNHISRLRRKLRTDVTGWRLNAVYQQGYRLESPYTD